MTATLLPLAHHGLVAIPFVVPVLALTLGVLVLAVRERRRREREA
jgi:cytochrome c-type biogenesis protein CcmH/NrfF